MESGRWYLKYHKYHSSVIKLYFLWKWVVGNKVWSIGKSQVMQIQLQPYVQCWQFLIWERGGKEKLLFLWISCDLWKSQFFFRKETSENQKSCLVSPLHPHGRLWGLAALYSWFGTQPPIMYSWVCKEWPTVLAGLLCLHLQKYSLWQPAFGGLNLSEEVTGIVRRFKNLSTCIWQV